VVYNFINFLPPNWNGSIARGTAVPVIFSLTDAKNRYINNAVADLTLQQYSGGIPVGAPIPATGTINVGDVFDYNTVTHQYFYILNTHPLALGTWQLQVRLNDGTVQTFFIVLD